VVIERLGEYECAAVNMGEMVRRYGGQVKEVEKRWAEFDVFTPGLAFEGW